MRTVNFQLHVLYGIAHLLGIDTERDIQRTHGRAWVSFINSATRDVWDLWDWRELNVTEERAFRMVWNDSRAFTRAGLDNLGPDEFYYLPNTTYYRVKADAPSDPPAGTLPTNATYFELLDPVTHYIAFQQTGRQWIGAVQGIYASDPGVSDTAVKQFDHGLSERGIELANADSNTVWIHYKRRPSEFTTVLYNSAKAYAGGDTILHTDGECYRAIAPTTNHPPSDVTRWALVPMPYVLSNYIKYRAAADAAESPKLLTKLLGQAEEALGRAIDSQLAQGQRLPRYQTGAPAARIPYGLSAWLSMVPKEI